MVSEFAQQKDRLLARGLRPTRARLWILGELGGRDDHPTAEMLLEASRRGDHPLSTATLYQNLNRLAEVGLLRRFPGPRGIMRFEADLGPHHHLVCAACGLVLDAQLDEEQVRRLQPVEARTGAPITRWTLQAARIELCGLCPDCQGD